MRTDQTLKGVLLAFASFAAYSWSDASVKMIEGALTPYEMGFFGAVFMLAGFPYLMKPGDSWLDVVRSTNRPLWMLRFFSAAMGTIGSVAAFTYLSMAEAFALIFLLPSFVTIMSVLFLKETVGIRRWSAVIIGFIGVLVILRPGFRELSIGHVGAVFAGFSGAISIIVYRAVGPSEKHISLYGAGVLGVLVILGILMIPDFHWPTLPQWAALATVWLMYAANYAPAAVIGPTQYSQMLWAILFGYLIFGDKVDLPMLVGIVLIIGSGLLTLARERARHVPLPASVATDAQAAVVTVPDAKSDT